MNDTNDDDYTAPSPMADDLDDGDLADTEFPATKKRARVTSCASSAAVPASVRRRVIASANSRCWLCSQHGKHVAHVIARSDRILFDEFRSTGLLHMASLHSFDNLVFLCHGCHGAFDERIPAWAFLPTPLAPFLAAELAFHTARAAAAAVGTRLQRPVPAATPPLLYARYQIRRGHVFTQVFRKKPTRLWAGNPVAAIVRSASVLMGVQRLDPLTRCGIPEDVAKTLQSLLWLYATPPPVVVDCSPPEVGWAEDMQEDSLGEEDDDEDDDDVSTVSGAEEEERVPEKSSSNRGRRHPPVGNQRKRQMTPPRSHQAAKKVRCEEQQEEDQDEAEWVFGPMVTAGRMVEWYCATRDG